MIQEYAWTISIEICKAGCYREHKINSKSLHPARMKLCRFVDNIQKSLHHKNLELEGNFETNCNKDKKKDLWNFKKQKFMSFCIFLWELSSDTQVMFTQEGGPETIPIFLFYARYLKFENKWAAQLCVCTISKHTCLHTCIHISKIDKVIFILCLWILIHLLIIKAYL